MDLRSHSALRKAAGRFGPQGGDGRSFVTQDVSEEQAQGSFAHAVTCTCQARGLAGRRLLCPNDVQPRMQVDGARKYKRLTGFDKPQGFHPQPGLNADWTEVLEPACHLVHLTVFRWLLGHRARYRLEPQSSHCDAPLPTTATERPPCVQVVQ